MRRLTLASEDSRYGVRLRGEADSERLGKRLKADFKRVAPAVKVLSSEALAGLQQSGSIEVEGCLLSVEDVKVRNLRMALLEQRYAYRL